MATYQKLANGKWQARVRKKGHDTSEVFKTKTAAEKWAIREEDRIEKIEAGVPLDDARQLSFGELLLMFKEKKGAAQKSWTVNKYLIANLPKKYLDLRVKTMSSVVWQKYVSDLIAEGIKPATICRRLDLWRSVVNWGIKNIDGLRGLTNVFLFVNRPTIGKENSRTRTATSTERQSIGDVSLSPWLTDFLELATETTARRAELASLTFSNVDYSRAVAHLFDTKNGDDREMPLSPKAIAVLKRRQASADNDFVFPGRPGKDGKPRHIRPDSTTKAFVKARKKVEGNHPNSLDLRLHDMRHTGATHWANAGFDIFDLQKITGHKDLSSLARYVNKKASGVAQQMAKLQKPTRKKKAA
jgi:integrase